MEEYKHPKLKEEHKCEHGWHDGSCCCNCDNQVEIMCHPWNGENKEFGWLEDKIKFGKGSISQRCGWGCSIFMKLKEKDSSHKVIFSDRQHGMCEMHCPIKEKCS